MADAKLFLSFNSQDRDKVHSVHAALMQRGLATFIEEQNLRAAATGRKPSNKR
jgi:hypothetical protein